MLYRKITHVPVRTAQLRDKSLISNSMRLATKVQREGVRIFKITPAGLGALTLGVLVLWGCFAGETITVRRAQNELHASLRQIERLRRRTEPVSRPATASPVRASAV